MNAKTDIWMPLYIGDYLADTSHLDAERHGCYLLWMMHYWRKGPLSNNLPDLVSIGKLRCDNASSIAQALLNEFFVMGEDGLWHQKRQDVEREKWQKKRDVSVNRAKKAASARWNDAPSIPQALLEPCPLPLPSPLPKKQKTNTIPFTLPDWVPLEQWEAWMPVRRAKKAANTTHALEIAVKRLAELKLEGFNPVDVLEQSILRGYSGLFPVAGKTAKPDPLAGMIFANGRNGNGKLDKFEQMRRDDEELFGGEQEADFSRAH